MERHETENASGVHVSFTGSDSEVVILATLVALLDVVFIVLIVPESLSSDQKIGIKSLTFKQVILEFRIFTNL